MIATTPNQISFVRLASLKGMVSLESKGLRGRSSPIRPKLAGEFDLAPRAPYDEYIAAIQAKMDLLLLAMKEKTA